MNTVIILSTALATQQGPEPADVKAGWTAFAVFLILIAAVALLGWSLVRQLRKAERNKEAGILPSSREQRLARQQERQQQGHAPQA
jgi:hypothetical protein